MEFMILLHVYKQGLRKEPVNLSRGSLVPCILYNDQGMGSFGAQVSRDGTSWF